jgi:hypothetical protein
MTLPHDMGELIRETLLRVPAQFPSGASDPAWTKAVKIAMGDLGASFDLEICTAGVPERPEWDKEWLYDLTWYRGNGGLLRLPLIMESEWKRDYENIRWDFEKLLVGRARFKVMVFQARDALLAEEHLARLKAAIEKYQGSKGGESYLLACLNEDKRKFRIETITPQNRLPTHQEMSPAYFETHFRREERWDDWPKEFAIITAYATTGEKWTDAENQEADRALEKELRQRAQWVRRLTGFSPTTNHAEPGWAVAIDFDPACEIGCAFRQDAIYYVTADALHVSFCDPRRRVGVEVGNFRVRVHDTGRAGGLLAL